MISNSVNSTIPLIFNDSWIAHMGSRVYRIALQTLEGVFGDTFVPSQLYSGERLYRLVDTYCQSKRDGTNYDQARLYYAGNIIRALKGERDPLEKTRKAKAILNTQIMGLSILQAKNKASLSKHISYTLLPSLIDEFGKEMATKSILALNELDNMAAFKIDSLNQYVNLYRDIALQQRELNSFVHALDQLNSGISKDILINELLLSRNRNLSKTAKDKIAAILQSTHYIDIKLHKKVQTVELVRSYDPKIELNESEILSELHENRNNQLEALCHRGPSMFFTSDELDNISLDGSKNEYFDTNETAELSESDNSQNNQLEDLYHDEPSTFFKSDELDNISLDEKQNEYVHTDESENVSLKKATIAPLPVGIFNFQQNCWYNAALQILIHTPIYQDISQQKKKFASDLPNIFAPFNLYERILQHSLESKLLNINNYIPHIRKEAQDNLDKEFNSKITLQEDAIYFLNLFLKHLSIDSRFLAWVPGKKIKALKEKYLLLLKSPPLSSYDPNLASIKIDLSSPFVDTNHKLHGVIFHKGAYYNGHYFAAVKIEDSWYICNDATIKEVSEATIEQYIQKNTALLIASRIRESKDELFDTEKSIDLENISLEFEIQPSANIDKPFMDSIELMKINRNLLELEDQVETLIKHLDDCHPTQVPHIRQQKKLLVDKYTELLKEKIEFVKTNFPNNPVYALAVPRTLRQGTLFFTAGSQEKIANLKQNGINLDSTSPATGLDPSARRGQWGINELGNRGIYFSKEEPAYLGDNLPIAIGCKLLQDISGVSLIPISTLSDAFGFTDEEINKGYDQIQKEFTFLQHDGLYPANTEVVFTKNENILQLNDEFTLNFHGNIVSNHIREKVHNSWLENPAKNPHVVRTLNGQVIKQLDDQGRCIVFDKQLRREVFFKPLRAGQQEIVIEAEIAASSLANSLLEELIPASYRVQRNNINGLGQNAINFSQVYLSGAVGTIDATHENAFDITALTKNQLEQLFAHSLVDWIISNTDVFPSNFGIDKEENIVGFDKGQAYKFFNGSKVQTQYAQVGIESNLPKLQPNFNDLQEDKSLHVHALLRDQLRKKKIIINFEAPIIQETIYKIKSLNKDQLTNIFEKYAKLAFPNQEKDFIDSIFDRCQDLDRAVNQFKNEL